MTKKKVAPKPAKLATTHLELTVSELTHLRDIMGVIVPSDEGFSVSESLSIVKGTPDVDESLWEKVVTACEQAGVPVGEDAQDFAIVPTGVPTMGVFPIASEATEGAAPEKK